MKKSAIHARLCLVQGELLSQVLQFLDVRSIVALDEVMSSCRCRGQRAGGAMKGTHCQGALSGGGGRGGEDNLEQAYKLVPLKVFDDYPYLASNSFAGVIWVMKREVRGFCPQNLVIPRVHFSLQLQYLLAHDMYDIAELIIRNSDRDFNLRPNESCMTILHYCAWKGMTHLVSLLLSKGADVSASYGTNMRTPYVTALQHGHTATVEALLKAGADVGLFQGRH